MSDKVLIGSHRNQNMGLTHLMKYTAPSGVKSISQPLDKPVKEQSHTLRRSRWHNHYPSLLFSHPPRGTMGNREDKGRRAPSILRAANTCPYQGSCLVHKSDPSLLLEQ